MLPSRSRILKEPISMYEISDWTGNSDIMDEIYPKKDISNQEQKKWTSPLNSAYSGY